MPRRTYSSRKGRTRPQSSEGALLVYLAQQIQRDAEERWYRAHPAVSYKDRHRLKGATTK